MKREKEREGGGRGEEKQGGRERGRERERVEREKGEEREPLTHHMVELLCTALVTVNHFSFVVARGQRTMEFIVDGIDLCRKPCSHVLDCILVKGQRLKVNKYYILLSVPGRTTPARTQIAIIL